MRASQARDYPHIGYPVDKVARETLCTAIDTPFRQLRLL
jgi:hypothetical protein